MRKYFLFCDGLCYQFFMTNITLFCLFVSSLLRPCISLTSVVQAGFGKYKSKEPLEGGIIAESTVAVDACTFDRVLLYLEHAARG